MAEQSKPALLILNQMAGPMTWELAEDLGKAFGLVALLTGHPDTLQKQHPNVQLFAAKAYERGTFARRAITWLHYCWQAFWWVWRWPKEIPLLLFSNPPILVWLGWLLQMLRGQQYAVMIHDIYPHVLVRTNMFAKGHPLIQLWRWLNRNAYEHAAAVMTLGDHMVATLQQQFDPSKTPGGKIKVIPPWVDTDVIKPIPKAENWFAQKYNQVDKLTVMYSGNMGIGHDIETMLEAARQLRYRDDIHFVFIGSGPKWAIVNEATKNELLPNVTLLGWQPESVIPFSLATADVALISMESSFEGIMIPSKSIYAMASGSALALLADGDSEIRDWIVDAKLGVVVKPGKSSCLVRQLDYWSSHKEKLTETCSRAVGEANLRFSRTFCVSEVARYLYETLSLKAYISNLD